MATERNSGRSVPRGTLAALAGILVIGCLGACSAPTALAPTETVAAPAGPTAAPAPVDEAPVLDPGGSAGENLAYFDHIANGVIGEGGDHSGGQFTSALAAAGFDIARMEVTPDATAVNLAAASVQFSVLMSDGCLIGQWGSEVGYHSIVTPVLASGRCLVGSERPAT